MLIALCLFLTKILYTLCLAMLEPVMVIFILLIGFTMLFGAIGIRISNNLGSTVVSGIFSAIGYVVRTSVRAMGWVIRNLIRLTPSIFNAIKSLLLSLGIKNQIVSNLLAAFITGLVILVIL